MELTLETRFILERGDSEPVILIVGGTHRPAGQLTEFDQQHGESTEVDWIEDIYGNRWAKYNFSPIELEAMRQRLIIEAEKAVALEQVQRKFANIRDILGLAPFSPERDFVE